MSNTPNQVNQKEENKEKNRRVLGFGLIGLVLLIVLMVFQACSPTSSSSSGSSLVSSTVASSTEVVSSGSSALSSEETSSSSVVPSSETSSSSETLSVNRLQSLELGITFDFIFADKDNTYDYFILYAYEDTSYYVVIFEDQVLRQRINLNSMLSDTVFLGNYQLGYGGLMIEYWTVTFTEGGPQVTDAFVYTYSATSNVGTARTFTLLSAFGGYQEDLYVIEQTEIGFSLVVSEGNDEFELLYHEDLPSTGDFRFLGGYMSPFGLYEYPDSFIGLVAKNDLNVDFVDEQSEAFFFTSTGLFIDSVIIGGYNQAFVYDDYLVIVEGTNVMQRDVAVYDRDGNLVFSIDDVTPDSETINTITAPALGDDRLTFTKTNIVNNEVALYVLVEGSLFVQFDYGVIRYEVTLLEDGHLQAYVQSTNGHFFLSRDVDGTIGSASLGLMLGAEFYGQEAGTRTPYLREDVGDGQYVFTYLSNSLAIRSVTIELSRSTTVIEQFIDADNLFIAIDADLDIYTLTVYNVSDTNSVATTIKNYDFDSEFVGVTSSTFLDVVENQDGTNVYGFIGLSKLDNRELIFVDFFNGTDVVVPFYGSYSDRLDADDIIITNTFVQLRLHHGVMQWDLNDPSTPFIQVDLNTDAFYLDNYDGERIFISLTADYEATPNMFTYNIFNSNLDAGYTDSTPSQLVTFFEYRPFAIVFTSSDLYFVSETAYRNVYSFYALSTGLSTTAYAVGKYDQNFISLTEELLEGNELLALSNLQFQSI